jgi:predicted nucleotide-binding protein
MAKRPPLPESPQLSPAQMQAAISRFRRRIAEVEAFDPNVQSRSDPKIKTLEVAIDEALSEAFGHRTPEYQRYRAAAHLDTAGLNYARPTPLNEVIQGLINGKERAIALLGQAVRSLEERLADLGEMEPLEGAVEAPGPVSRDVFIVHGRDDPAKIEVARLIERAGLNAVILHEQPNAGRTIIEKFEEHGGSAGFAVVVLTIDDIGGPDEDDLRPRARQNVIGEMFWFAGKLGRDRVCALKKGDIEIPTDFAGVVYTEMDDRGAWKAELLRELKAAGYEVDWGKALA